MTAGPSYRDLGFQSPSLVFCGLVYSESLFLQPVPVFRLLYKERTVLVPRGELNEPWGNALHHRAALSLWSSFPRGCGRRFCQHPGGSTVFFSRIYRLLLQRLPCGGGLMECDTQQRVNWLAHSELPSSFCMWMHAWLNNSTDGCVLCLMNCVLGLTFFVLRTLSVYNF